MQTGVNTQSPTAETKPSAQCIGVPRELFAGEKRVATVPDVVEKLIKLGFSVPLGQRLLTDERRVALAQARALQTVAEADQAAALNKLLLDLSHGGLALLLPEGVEGYGVGTAVSAASLELDAEPRPRARPRPALPLATVVRTAAGGLPRGRATRRARAPGVRAPWRSRARAPARTKKSAPRACRTTAPRASATRS